MFETFIALAVLFILSAVTSYVVTMMVKRTAEAIGAVDHPDVDTRRMHLESTPRLGGLAIIFGFGFPLLLLAGNHHAASLVSKNTASSAPSARSRSGPSPAPSSFRPPRAFCSGSIRRGKPRCSTRSSACATSEAQPL